MINFRRVLFYSAIGIAIIMAFAIVRGNNHEIPTDIFALVIANELNYVYTTCPAHVTGLSGMPEDVACIDADSSEDRVRFRLDRLIINASDASWVLPWERRGITLSRMLALDNGQWFAFGLMEIEPFSTLIIIFEAK
jgi:hypothetical protein